MERESYNIIHLVRHCRDTSFLRRFTLYAFVCFPFKALEFTGRIFFYFCFRLFFFDMDNFLFFAREKKKNGNETAITTKDEIQPSATVRTVALKRNQCGSRVNTHRSQAAVNQTIADRRRKRIK